MKNLKMSTKILATVMVVTGVGLILLYILANYSITSSMKQKAIENMNTYLDGQTSNVENFVKNSESALLQFSKSDILKQALKNPTDAKITGAAQQYTLDYYGSLKNWEGLYLGDWNTKVFTHPAKPVIGKVMREGDRLKELRDDMLASDGVLDYGIIVSPASGKLILSMYYPLMDGKNPIGYVGAGVFSAELKESLATLKATGLDKAKTYMINTESKMNIYNENEEVIAKEIDDPMLLKVVDQIKADGKETGELEYKDSKGTTSLVRYNFLKDRGWALILADDETEIYAAAASNQRSLLIVCIIAYILIAILTIIVVMITTKPLKQVQNSIIKLGKLDLGQSTEIKKYIGAKNEVGNISTAVEELRMVLTEIVGTLSNCSESLGDASQTMTDGSVNLLEYVTDNAATTEELAASINTTNSSIQGVHDMITQINEMVSQIEEKVETGRDQSDELMRQAATMEKSSLVALQSSVESIKENREKISVAVGNLQALSQINDLADEILSITSQTNLLSLNASIEAARAGESGRGFAVVADEIGNLAKDSAETVSRIQNICSATNANINEVNQCFEDIINFLETEVAGQFEDFSSTSKENSAAAMGLQKEIEEIKAIANQFDEYIGSIEQQMENLKFASNQNECGVDDIVQKNSQTNTIAEELSNMASTNQDNASMLSSIITRFVK